MKMPQPPDLVLGSANGRLVARVSSEASWMAAATPCQERSCITWRSGTRNRADFLCPNKEEHIFGAGSELTDWAEVPGYGYRVQTHDKIRIETMVYNPTATSYEKAYLEVQIPFVDASAGSVGKMIQNVYPAWMDVASCGDSGYDVPAGKSEKTGTVTVKYDGVLLGVGGHMHDYGKQIVLQDASRKETVATLDAKSTAQGHLESVPVKLFVQEGGLQVCEKAMY